MVYNPFLFALWLVVACVSFGISLGWGTLIVLGFVAPLMVLGLYLLTPLRK